MSVLPGDAGALMWALASLSEAQGPALLQGEIASTDRELVPKPSPPPSTDFLQQLREYTPWRMKVDAAEPAARTHLGAKRSSSSAVK